MISNVYMWERLISPHYENVFAMCTCFTYSFVLCWWTVIIPYEQYSIRRYYNFTRLLYNLFFCTYVYVCNVLWWLACIIFIQHVYFKCALCTLFITKSVNVLALCYNGHIVLFKVYKPLCVYSTELISLYILNLKYVLLLLIKVWFDTGLDY